MDAAAVHVLVDRVAELAPADRAHLEQAAREVRRLKSWIEGREVAVARELAKVSSFPEKTLGDASHTSVRDAGRTLERARTVEVVPMFGDALDAGEISAAHVDVLGRALQRTKPAVGDQIVAQSASLLAVARQATPQEFARTVESVQRRFEVDADREARLARQRQATRLRTWIDADGMGRMTGAFDPQTAVELFSLLDRTVETVFREQHPEHCPTDAREKQDFLRAHALLRLVDGTGGRGRRRGEAILVVDATNPGPDGRPTLDWGYPVELPDSAVHSFLVDAHVSTVVVDDGRVRSAPGTLDLGRRSRLASFDQRRALAGLYATCAIPGCTVSYWRCKLHHVTWWERSGSTDLANLLPVCEHHHHRIHDDGWQVAIDDRRCLTVTFPDGETMSTGPPHRQAA